MNFAEARTIYRELGCPNRHRLALLHFSEGKPELAEEEAHEAVVIFQAADAGHLLGLALTVLGIVERCPRSSRADAFRKSSRSAGGWSFKADPQPPANKRGSAVDDQNVANLVLDRGF